jgi:neutral ceramidase
MSQSAVEAQCSLRVGVGRADITPSVEVLNWVTGKPYGSVADPLSLHALWMEDALGGAALIIRWDLVDVSESARDEVRRRIVSAMQPEEQLSTSTGSTVAAERAASASEPTLLVSHILVHASHTHSAPWCPIYAAGYRGRELDTWWSLRFMPAQDDFPPYAKWKERLMQAAVDAALDARRSARQADMRIVRVNVGEFLHHRRPRYPKWGLQAAPLTSPLRQLEDAATSSSESVCCCVNAPPPLQDYSHPQWEPDVAQGGSCFGNIDRALTLLTFNVCGCMSVNAAATTANDAKSASGTAAACAIASCAPIGSVRVATLFHVGCHSVSIYPTNSAVSADWPAAVAAALQDTGNSKAPALFLQGCAGDINPWRRGPTAVEEMAAAFSRKAAVADPYAVRLKLGAVLCESVNVDLPLTAEASARLGQSTVRAEVWAMSVASVAWLALPGEPMTAVGDAIRLASPFPHTLVLGYSNGNGAHYVGLAGEKEHGGYEAGTAGAGTDECAALMITAASQLLQCLFARTDSKLKT